MERRQEKKIGYQDIVYILNLFLDSTTIQWVRKLFLNPLEMVASPRQGVKNVLVVLWYICPNLGFEGVNNVLDALVEICLNPVFLVVCSIGRFWYFLYFGCMLTVSAAASKRLASDLPKDVCVGPPTSSKKNVSVVTAPVTVEKERVSFFCWEGSFLRMRHPFSYQGLLGV